MEEHREKKCFKDEEAAVLTEKARPAPESRLLPPSAQGAGELHHGLADVLLHGD